MVDLSDDVVLVETEDKQKHTGFLSGLVFVPVMLYYFVELSFILTSVSVIFVFMI